MTYRQMTHCLCQFLDRVRFDRREFGREHRIQGVAHGAVKSSSYIVGTYDNQRNNPSIAVRGRDRYPDSCIASERRYVFHNCFYSID